MSPVPSGRLSATRRGGAFTLIELLVVIAIIAILAAILFPVFAQAREKARQTSCLSNMKQIMTAVRTYAQDFDETTPDFPITVRQPGNVYQPYEELIYPYIKSKEVFICPSAETDPDAYMQDSFGASGYSSAAGFRVISTYYWDINPYSYWYTPSPGVPGVTAAFYGSPVPASNAANADQVYPGISGICKQPYTVCANGEQADRPAEVKFLEEGFVVALPVAGTQFGDVYGLSGAFDLTNEKDRLYNRHAEGQNFAYADGHVKFSLGRKFLRDYSSRTGGAYAGYPQSPMQRVGP